MKLPFLTFLILIMMSATPVRAATMSPNPALPMQMMGTLMEMMEWFMQYRRLNPSNMIPLNSAMPLSPNANSLSSMAMLGLMPNQFMQGEHSPLKLATGGMPFSSMGGGDNILNMLGIGTDMLQGSEKSDDQQAATGNLGQKIKENIGVIRSGYEGIDGVWSAKTGERWMVKGDRFILFHASGGSMSGYFQIKDDWIYARAQDGAQTISFQFRQMDDLLLIRDQQGSVVLLYRNQQRNEGQRW